MIGKTALAFTAAIIIASTAALFVGAAGFAMFAALRPAIGEAGAAASVAGVSGLFLLIVLFFANLSHSPRAEPQAPAQLHDFVSLFSETIGERPLLTLGLTALTGLAATRDPGLLKDLWAAMLHKRDPRGRA